MTVQPPTPRDPTRALWLLFAGAWLAHFAFSVVGWDNTLLNRLQFRQLQTAMTALFIPPGSFPLAYETPLFGPPWPIPLEFPLYQVVVAWFSSATGMALDPAGRLVAWLFFQAALPAVYLLLGSLGVRRPLRLLGLSLLVTSPLYLFFSRAFLIESTALCFSAWFLAAFARWVAGRGMGWLLLASVAGALAASVKATTAVVFCVAAALFSAGYWWRQWREEPTRARPLAWRVLLRSAAAAVVPILGGLAWLVYSTAVRTRNPESEILNTVFGFWSFGDVAQRLSLEFWARTGAVWTTALVGEGGLVLGLLLAARARPPVRLLAGGLMLAFLSGQLIFSNLYFVHDYYFYASGVFLILALGLLLGAQFEDETIPAWARWGIPIVLILLQIASYSRTYLPPQRTNTEVPELAGILESLTRPDDMIVILGQDWDAIYPYYARRRALMFVNGRERDPAGIARSVQRLDAAKVGAVVLWGHLRNDSTFAAEAMGHLNLGPTPLLLNHPMQVGVWFPRPRHAEVMDKFPAHPYRTVDFVLPRPAGDTVFTLGLRDLNRMPEFNSLARRPLRASSISGFSRAVVDNHPVINAHAPSELAFRAQPDFRAVRAVFGIHDGAYANPASGTDGVEFSVLHRAPDGRETTLFSRLLDPARRSADQGLQHLELKLDRPLEGEILFRVGPGPHGSASYDWAYLGKIELK